MSEEMVIRCCAPTLAAIKTRSLFNCAFDHLRDMTDIGEVFREIK